MSDRLNSSPQIEVILELTLLVSYCIEMKKRNIKSTDTCVFFPFFQGLVQSILISTLFSISPTDLVHQ